MLFKENFNDVCDFIDYHEELDDGFDDIDYEIFRFYAEYEKFKKEHDLENKYFSRIVNIKDDVENIMEVWYEVSDLYLTYLEANGDLPEGVCVKRHLLKESYLHGSEQEHMLIDALLSLMSQVTPDRKVYGLSKWIGCTERILISNPSDGLSGEIVNRIPMTYEELKM